MPTEFVEYHESILEEIINRTKLLNIKFILHKLQYCQNSVKSYEFSIKYYSDQVKTKFKLK